MFTKLIVVLEMVVGHALVTLGFVMVGWRCCFWFCVLASFACEGLCLPVLF